ncbi:MAG: glycosyltransferase family 4 protein [Saprospiraceae bacterium]|nr:glycosyltransferase family 4 protein [Saprospiraceae bacterium]
MKKIIYLSYHYPPDLSAGSFRNASLANALAGRLESQAEVHLFCTQPNRYSNHIEPAAEFEQEGNLFIYRIPVPQHKNRFFLQMRSFYVYFNYVRHKAPKIHADFIFASTSKLFTGYLAYRISKMVNIPYYIDLRDLFVENLKEFLRIPFLAKFSSWFIGKYFEKPCLLQAAHINVNSRGFLSSIPKDFTGTTSFYPNGIDEMFLNWKKTDHPEEQVKIICYAGNVGEAQGLHYFIPALAKKLEAHFRFLIIGNGSAMHKLNREIYKQDIKNVNCIPPVNRSVLLSYYSNSDYLLIHLHPFKSLEKVLPSKLFEYAAGDIPVLAGVSGYTRDFMESEVKNNIFIFNPGDVDAVCDYLVQHIYKKEARPEFVEKYNRTTVTRNMVESVIQVMHKHTDAV